MKGHLKPTDDCEDFMNPATRCPMCRCREPHSPQCSAPPVPMLPMPMVPPVSLCAVQRVHYSTVQYSTAAGACSGLARTRGWLAAGGGARRSAPPGARSLAVVLATHRGADITYR